MTAAPAPYTARVTTLVEACIQRMLSRTLKRVEDVREAQWRLVAIILERAVDRFEVYATACAC